MEGLLWHVLSCQTFPLLSGFPDLLGEMQNWTGTPERCSALLSSKRHQPYNTEPPPVPLSHRNALYKATSWLAVVIPAAVWAAPEAPTARAATGIAAAAASLAISPPAGFCPATLVQGEGEEGSSSAGQSWLSNVSSFGSRWGGSAPQDWDFPWVPSFAEHYSQVFFKLLRFLHLYVIHRCSVQLLLDRGLHHSITSPHVVQGLLATGYPTHAPYASHATQK